MVVVAGPVNCRKKSTFKSIKEIFHEFWKPGSAAMLRLLQTK